jgi:hypothetical protein
MRTGLYYLSILALIVIVTGVGHAGTSGQPASGVDFNRDIRPILSNNCFACHGPDTSRRRAKLRLDVRDVALRKRAVLPGKPDESELVTRIFSEETESLMPPPKSNKRLTPVQKELLKRWVAEGALYQKHWAYQTPVRGPTPAVRDAAWPANWIDCFLLARLERAGLAPSPQADRVTLLRRVTFDLTGLPPTPAEVDAFLQDHRPTAWERVVDRLLASGAYGERMATYWLDLVRFADTVGYHGDQDHNISPYRDYVIDALNDNMPFDRFTREQLAGDLLPGAGIDQKIATGYNRLLQTSHEGGVQPKEYLAIYAADRMRNLSAVWLGGTLGCAQCHDHKFDPYTQKDFYSLAAFFADVDEAQHLRKGADTVPTVRLPEIKVLTGRERALLAGMEEEIRQLGAKLGGLLAESPEAKELRRRKLDVEKQRDALQKNARLTMITVSITPRTMRLLPRGNWLDDSGPVVQPAVPEFLGSLPVARRRPNRLDLANWLVDPKDGVGLLTARVMVNRFWHLCFGQGLARVLDDFGGQGEPPSHPELLDRLAHEFVESGWDIKHMMRLLVTSRAYRQSSTAGASPRARDPENRLLARQGTFRLPAEMVRDNALAISGLLVRQLGGPSVKPYQPNGYYRHLNFPKRTYKHHADERQWRRGVYIHWQRQYLHPMLKALDAPSREECTAQRPRSNTPLAALVLLNDSSFLEAARVFAERILREGGDTTEARLDYAFRRALARTPDAQERKLLTELLADNRKEYAANPRAARELIAIGQAPVAAGLGAVEWAAWTSVTRTILNLSETNTRN